MPLGKEFLFGSEGKASGAIPAVRLRLRTFQVPPVRDGVVIGRDAPIGRDAMTNALRLLSLEPFVGIDLDDDIVASILVRDAVLRKIDGGRLQAIVLESVKPLMSRDEIVALQLEIEVALGESI